MIVLKFGGTSVGSAQRIRSVARLVAKIPGRKIVVLSAMSGTTDALVQLSALLAEGKFQEAAEAVETLEKRYNTVIKELFDDEDLIFQARLALRPQFDELRAQTHNEAFTKNDEKRILSKGEIISIQLMLLTLRHYEQVFATHLNALSFMRINHDGEPEPDYIASHLQPLLASNSGDDTLFLAEGYICVNAFGEIDNLRRGGSDYSATLIGEAAQADEIQIWTDIDGLHNNDPRIVNVTSPVRKLHFSEAAELAHFGAKILHPACIEPARRAGIPIRLLYTLDPEAQGTTISNDTNRDIIKAVSAKDGISIISVSSKPTNMGHPTLSNFLIYVADMLRKHGIKADFMASMGETLLLAVEHTPEIEAFAAEVGEEANVMLSHNMVIIAIVGDMNWERVSFESRILEALNDVPIRMISYGTSDCSLIIAVSAEDKKRAMIALSDHLFSQVNLQSPEIY